MSDRKLGTLEVVDHGEGSMQPTIAPWDLHVILGSYVHDRWGGFQRVQSVRVFADSTFHLYGDDGPIWYDRNAPVDYYAAEVAV